MSQEKVLNVDPSEISKFERMANRWWDLNGEFKPLHEINPIRANYVDARSPVAEQRLVDIGCGGGIFCEAMAQRGAMVTGIDMGAAPLEVAKLHSLESGVTVDYQQKTVEQLAEEQPESFNIVTCLEMLEHVPDPAQVVYACAQLAKPGAHLFFSTINRNIKSYGMAVVGAEYLLKLLPKGTHEYKKFIRPSELASWVRLAGLELHDVSGITYNPLTKRYRLNPDDVDVNYLIHVRKPL
ncbi:bifunctional 2-polyprenyl-6-hydroxyphenol methylase/3-demethylubiquinol 3-O-methyltransferase UbiG [Teredinibacter sp. KSP-S5-2]|uniref:bifunctional 2-polyprenyl-6-hydroxyphenol methylase/3-demethylubiquinol 3-O-methyltransferase UbiG n=1 Tax=Teredinibacter sp. KSP-S5-2 TaxID=3034506 RepID=UPI00293457AD|nr:bifunctional 2-polyprenyl-6-hydroxyphenol methylase/3-demethylubiquinol 3-O-methyltransferase UbiG [Teredinibacter sp. KSP-S5-2]WNO07880.1 bifunctional 2-polyprenyl-6-hydroxyphenol methylase/3-demethylubiquinol 3-O-methyltransferase UbiG [Teredinibacter sp. KSP-S5-2]